MVSNLDGGHQNNPPGNLNNILADFSEDVEHLNNSNNFEAGSSNFDGGSIIKES